MTLAKCKTKPSIATKLPINQNLIVTVNSFHPLYSKWWCIGAISNIFLPLNFFDRSWIITDSVSITKIKQIKGRTKIVSVSIAITPIVAPSAKEPVSPMKNFAGGMLFHKNAAVAPANTAQKVARINNPCVKDITARLSRAVIDSPDASPSRPSVILTALELPIIINKNSGM